MKKLSVILLLCITISAFGQFQQKPLLGVPISSTHPLGTGSGGLVGAWFMLEGSGGQVSDLSGNGNDGTFESSMSWVPGKFGYATDYALPFGRISLGTPAILQPNLITIVAWIRLRSTPSTWYHIFGSDFTEGAWLSIGGAENKVTFYTKTGAGAYDTWIDIGNAFATNTWHQVVGVWDGASKHIYFDGVYVDSKASDAGNLNWGGLADIRIGAADDAGYNFDGQIDHILVYDHVKTASEISLLYREPFCMFEVDDIALMGVEAPAPTGGQVIMITSLPWIFFGLYLCRKYKAA